ncbi:MAG: 50S ribosomal protein L11 methyltransferase, partial [Candidatus Omnitrophota bacterium]
MKVLAGHFPARAYLEVSIRVSSRPPSRRKGILDFFRSRGIGEERLVTSATRTFWKACFYTRSRREISRMVRGVGTLEAAGLKLETRLLGPADWLDKWKRHYRTRPLGERFAVVPVWERGRNLESGRIPILLDPGAAFGSGTHESTRLAITGMERLAGRFENFLDLGTGTGILAVAAANMGAREVQAIDHDAHSVRIARRNYALNGCRAGDFRRLDLRQFNPRRRYDLVAANLLSKTLLEYAKKIRNSVRPGGFLIVSGIHRSNLKAFLAGFRHPE